MCKPRNSNRCCKNYEDPQAGPILTGEDFEKCWETTLQQVVDWKAEPEDAEWREKGYHPLPEEEDVAPEILWSKEGDISPRPITTFEFAIAEIVAVGKVVQKIWVNKVVKIIEVVRRIPLIFKRTKTRTKELLPQPQQGCC